MPSVNASVGRVDIGGTPDESEVAAIVAAIEAAWPKPVVVRPRRAPRQTAWRYSGRWWSEGRLPTGWR